MKTTAWVNLANGNLTVVSNDGTLNGPTVELRNDRYYNSQSGEAGVFGGGWFSTVEEFGTSLDGSPGNDITYRTATGYKAEFEWNGSGYDPAPGLNATLELDGSDFELEFHRTGQELSYAGSGKLETDEDRNGVGNTYHYDGSGNIDRVYDAAGRYYELGRNTNPDLLDAIADSSGRTWEYARNGAGQLQRVDGVGDYWEEFTYNANGLLESIEIVGSFTTDSTITEFEYDGDDRIIKVSQSASGASVPNRELEFAYDGNETTVTDGRGNDSLYEFDSEGRVEETTDQLGHERSQTWTTNSDVATITNALAGPNNTTTYNYDSLNNLTGAELPTGAAASAGYSTGSSCAGTGGTAFQPKCSTNAEGDEKKYDYDGEGNLTTITDTTPGGTGAEEQEFEYENSSGTICGGFDGQICSAEDGEGNVTEYDYDADGNLIQITQPAPLGATTLDYDSLGRVIEVVDGNGDTTNYSYNVHDLQVAAEYDTSNTVFLTEYWPNLLKWYDADSLTNVVIGYAWDPIGRIGVRVYNEVLESAYGYDGNGNLTSFSDANGTVDYSYDAANNLTSLIEPSGSCTTGTTAPTAGSGCIKIEYDDDNNEVKRTFPGGAHVAFDYDDSNRPERVTATDASAATVVDIEYDYEQGGDDTSKIQKRISHVEVGVPAGAVTDYAYDSRGRLEDAEETSGSTTTARWEYDYDDAGNRTEQIRSGTTLPSTGTITYAYNAANQLTSTSADTGTWDYDDAGNLLEDGITGQTYEYNDRLTTTSIGLQDLIAFGPGNQQVIARSPSTVFVTTQLGLSTQVTGSNSIAFTRAGTGEVLGSRQGTSGRSYFIKDSIGSVVGIFDAGGNWQGGYSYSPYGEQRAASSTTSVTGNAIRYISGYWDGSVELYKLGARYYDPSSGRFTQPDPSGQEANPYAYAACDPVNSSDPTGLDAAGCGQAITDLVIGGVAFIAGAATFIVGALAEIPTAGVSTLLLVAGAISFIGGLYGIVRGGTAVGIECG